MGRIGKAVKSFIDKLSGSGTNAQFASVEEFANDQRKSQLFGPCNEDFALPTNCKTYDEKLGRGRGFLVSLAYHNQLITPVALPGERRIYSTNKAGDTVVAEAFLKQDGTILIKNAKVTITATPSGELTIVTTGNTEITSAKTIINNDVDIIGDVDITGSLDVSVDAAIVGELTAGSFGGDVNMTSGVIKGANVFNGPDSNLHGHEQDPDSATNTQVKTDAPS